MSARGGFERGHEGDGEGVAGGWAVEGEGGDAGLVVAEQDVGVGHGGFLVLRGILAVGCVGPNGRIG